MKFGNYNLANATEKHNRLFFARLKKVKNTSNYIVGKFNNQINTIRKINKRKANLHRYRQYTDSPLSYRASLFDNRRQHQYHRHLLSQSEKCRELRAKLEKYRTSAEHIYETCEKYVPDDFHRPTSSLFDRQSPSYHCVFDKVKFSKINNAITGKRSHKMLKNVFFTIKSNQCQNISLLYDSMEYEEVTKKNSLKKSYKFSPPKTIENLSADKKFKNSLTSLLKIQKCDEKTELEVLKNYFESMTYSDICNDDDFKNYLKKKNYQDAIDYIYSGHSLLGSSLREESMYGSVTDVLKRYYDLDLDIVKDPSNQNDCDSVKNEKRNCRRSLSIDRRKYYNKENSEFFCKSNKEFDDYYKRNIAIFYEATKTIDDDFLNKDCNSIEEDAYRTYDQLFYHHNSSEDELLIDRLYECKNQSQQSYNTMPEKRKNSKDLSNLDRSRISFDIDVGNIIDGDDTFYDDDEHGNENDNNENDNSEFKKKYQTYPLKRKTKRNYKQLLRYCEKSLANYSTVADMKLDKWCKSSGKSKEFSEKAYNKIIKAFVRLRGFETIECYVQYHYGRILDKSFDNKLKSKLREALSKRNEQLVISRPILRTTTQSSVIANNRLDSLPPPYTSIDSDNNYFYKKHQSSSDKKFKPASTVIDANKKASSKALDDCFKHYDYIESNYGSKIHQPSSTVNGNELRSQFLFRFVEDMHDVGIKFDEILLDQSQLDSDDDDEEEKTYENFLESENYPLHCDMHSNQDISNNNCFETLAMLKTDNNSNTQINHMKLSEASMCNDNIYESIENAHRRCKSNINNNYQHQQRNSSKNNSIIQNRSHENETNAANEKGYKDKLLSEEMQSMVPAGLQGNADILFGNLQEIYTFHSDVFLKDLENSICLTELVALCFVQRRDVFFRLYSYYCQNIPRSERLRETLVDTHLFLSECQKKLGHKLPLAAYLLKPVQRITKYQLLLKDLLKFSDSGTCTKELQKALDCMLVVLKCVNDSMHQIAITGFPADLSQQGDLLLQDSFQICSENKKDIKLRIKPQQRHVFLYQKAILFCKQDTKTGHNKSTYQFKHWLKMSQIGLTESVRGDVKKFEVWLQGRSEVHTFQAATIEIKGKWVSEIKRVLMNQLEELKDEKIKQYGNHVNHRPLKQSNSGSYEVPSMNINQRAMSVESTPENAKQRNITPPITVADDANNTWNSTGISASSSEHDNHETNAWSSDCSNSEDDNTFLEENAVPTDKFRRKKKADDNDNGDKAIETKHRNSAQMLVEACNLKVKERITMYQALTVDLESPSKSNTNPCSIVVSDFDEANKKEEIVVDEAKETTEKRLSIASNSSIESSPSDNNNCDGVNIEYGSSVFYVIWD